jgi:D-amino-acid dehydrogenase
VGGATLNSMVAADDMPLQPLAASECACDVLVIGAGIVGLAIALRLQREGRQVTVLDRKGVAAEASRGNAGAFAFTDILPLASPGMLRQAPRWLLDPLGPLSIAPAYLPRIAPWLFHFWRASSPERVKASAATQAALMDLSIVETDKMLAAAGATNMLRSNGVLHLYESEAEFAASQPGWQARADHGIAFTHLHGAQAIAELQPGLSATLVAATFLPAWKTIADPLRLTLALAARFTELGGRVRGGEALALEPSADGIVVPLAQSQRVAARQVVVAAGAWSHRLARTLGDRIPLETERGYNTTLPVAAFDLKRQLTFGGHGFVVTPLACGVRVGGAVEFAGLDAPPNFRRSEVLLAKAKRFMPGLATSGGTQWMGFRPSLPDSLPAIGAATRDTRVTYAFGHGHLGLTQAAATARLVADIVFERPSALDLSPLRPQRFTRAP